jgi:hypothetical protein
MPSPESKITDLTQPPAKEEKQVLNLDLADPTEAALADYAGRIGKLLSAPATRANPDLAGSLDDFLGAVYALVLAKHHQFQDRPDRPVLITPIAQRAARIAAGIVRTDGLWVAGFYFNNALFRTAAVYHRLLKIVTGKIAYAPVLLIEAKRLYPHWLSDHLQLVHSQVNDLKHTPGGVHDQRTATYDDARAAVGELLDLIEAWMPATPKVTP